MISAEELRERSQALAAAPDDWTRRLGVIERYEEHFRNLTRRNKGKLKVLEGLAALEDVTGKN